MTLSTMPTTSAGPPAATKQVETYLMPVVFTTANLWTSDVDLRDAEIVTGDLAKSSVSLTPVSWLYLQYAMSPRLKHSLARRETGFELADLLEPHYMRTIAIVNADGIEEFFKQLDPDGLIL